MSAPSGTWERLLESSQDEILVQHCLSGDQQTWSELIDKYKNLIFSVAVKSGFSRADAAEIFQSVCLTLLRELSHIREPRALAAWLIRVTTHQCIRFRREQQRNVPPAQEEETLLIETGDHTSKLVEELEAEQLVREAVSELSRACRRLVQFLFFEDPPVPYDTAAKMLGIARGSMGATRMRCLKKLRRALEKRGFR
ncbi:MAG: RNA polymerase sigma factor [Acidobacteriaceae bacterium]|nr:RNA polymerase sigma factor [Acidobacteriaceae bacterium]